MNKWNKYIAEFIGTFALVFAGCGAIIVNDIYGGAISHIGVAVTFGLIVMAMVYSIGDISGAHINPAVTFGFFVARKFPPEDTAIYMLSQTTGAVFASGLLFYLFPMHKTLGATLPIGSVWQAFSLEIILSFLLMFVVFHVSTGSKEKGVMAGLAVGGVVALDTLFGGPITGASMNPARSFAPAIISGNIECLWVYLTAPFIGVLLACFTYHVLQER